MQRSTSFNPGGVGLRAQTRPAIIARDRAHRLALIAICAERGNYAVSVMGSLVCGADDEDEREYRRAGAAVGANHVARWRR